MEKILFGWLVLMLAGMTAAGAYVLIDHATRCDRFHFDRAEWRDPHAHRNEMAHRLAECHRLDGLSTAEVRAQLGPPREKHRLFQRPRSWAYDAGTDKGFIFSSPQDLEVEMTPGGIVKRARVVDAVLDD